METEIPSGVIRKIIIGLAPKDGMSFSVGQIMGGFTVTDIIKDKNYFYKFGKIRFLIYVRRGGALEQVLWKEVSDMPVIVEYDTENVEKLV